MFVEFMKLAYLFIKSNKTRAATTTALILTALVSSQNCTQKNSSPTPPSQQSTVVPKGNRILGIDVNSVAQDTNFNQTFSEAQNIGSVAADMLIEWSSVETTAGNGTTHGTYVD